MKKSLLGLGAKALILSLAACGETGQPQNEVVAEDSNATTNSEERLPANVPACSRRKCHNGACDPDRLRTARPV